MVIFFSPRRRLFDYTDLHRVRIYRWWSVRITFCFKIVSEKIIYVIYPKPLSASPANLLEQLLKGTEG